MKKSKQKDEANDKPDMAESDDDAEDAEQSSDAEDAERSEAAEKPSDADEGRTVFVRNLAYECTEHKLRDLFKRFGRIEQCSIVRDRSLAA